MDMHELEQAWRGLDARLASQDRQLLNLRRERRLDHARARMRRFSTGLLAQLAIGLLAVVWAGQYWYGYLGELHLVVYGVSVHLFGLGLLVTAALQLAWLARIDYRRPLVDVQQQLLGLRRLRIRCERVLLLAGSVIWLPLLLIALNAVGIDLWQTRPGNVIANVGVAAVIAMIVAWLLHRHRGAFERDAAGRSLREAERELAELAGE